MNHNTTNIHTEGGSANTGTINVQDGDFVTRDKIINNYKPLDPADSRNQRNHAVLRQTVRRFWIDGVLKRSLYNEMQLRLGLEARPDAVDNRPWDLILQQPGQPDEAIGDNKEIATLFDEMNQRLLILGEPGAGKTTTLLTLTDALLRRADADPTLPTAVVFNLSSWAEKMPPLDEWLVDELWNRYHMPKKVSQNWVENDELLLLLDGLDEVAVNKRVACIQAINQFRQDHVVGMVVSSRTTEYSALSQQLKLEGAVEARPLTAEQVDDYLTQTGLPLTGLRQTLAQSQELRDLAQTPLMLSVMALAYHDQNTQPDAMPGERTERQHLFDRYLQRMFEHRELPQLYPADQTLRWLRWLAVQMRKRSQTLFLIERLHPDWLGTQQQVNLYQLIFRLSIGLIFGLSVWLSVGLISGLSIGLITGLSAGLITGLMAGMLTHFTDEGLNNFSPKKGLIFGLSGGLCGELYGGLIGGLIAGLIAGLYDIQSWQKLKEIWSDRLIVGLYVWMGVALLFDMNFMLIDEPADGLLAGMFLGGSFWSVTMTTSIGRGRDGMRSEAVEFKEQPNQRIWQSLKNGLIAVTGSTLIFGLISGSVGGLVFLLIVGSLSGLDSCRQHLVLRYLLYQEGRIPWNYARFLDYAAARLFLRKVGGGYVFIHRIILEHFASLSDEDIARIVKGV